MAHNNIFKLTRIGKACNSFKSNFIAFIVFVGIFFQPMNLNAIQLRKLFNGSVNHYNYNSNKIDQHPQNWGITQSPTGVIYFANQGGVVEYDGVTWKRINLPNIVTRSIDIDPEENIYVGSYGDFGYLYPDSTGILKYKSLVEKIPAGYRDFSNVFYTFSTKNGVIFNAIKYLFKWDGLKIIVIPSESSFHCGFKIDDTFYVKENGIGIKKIAGDSLVFIEGSEIFADKKIYSMFRTFNGNILIGTRSNGFYLYDGNSFSTFKTEVDEYILSNLLSNGIQISNGDYAFTTLRGGMVVIDSTGALNEIFSTQGDLESDDVKYVFEDNQNNIWLALNDGISKIEYASPFRFYSKNDGLNGIVLSIYQDKKNFYVGSTNGLFYNEISNFGDSFNNNFQSVQGIESICWDILSSEGKLITALTPAPVKKLSLNNIITINNCYAFIKSKVNGRRIYAAMSHGLSSYILNKDLREEYIFPQITEEIRSLSEDKNGDLWLGTLTNGVIKVVNPESIINNEGSKIEIKRYDSSNGLPDGEIHIFYAAKRILFGTNKGLYSFDTSKNIFVADSLLGKEFSDGSRNVFKLSEDEEGNIWFHSQTKNFGALPNGDGSYKIISKPFNRNPDDQVNAILPDENYVWFGTKTGLIRYDKKNNKKYDVGFNTLIRSVKFNNDSLLFGGNDFDDTELNYLPEIEYAHRNMRFEFTAAFYEDESRNMFQYRLEGYDDDWSSWTTETKKDYTNLSEGKYTFYVRAKNIYGTLGNIDTYSFYVLPPFYRTWLAYIIYVFLFVSVGYVFYGWRMGKLEKEKKELESIVQQRTEEVRKQKEELERKNITLEEQSEQLLEMDKTKSRFFANISHEFRTPLTLIIGPLEQWLEDKSNENEKSRISMMLRNSKRLLGLINELLDLSKMESGQIDMQIYKLNASLFLKGISGTFRTLADERKINYQVKISEQNIDLYCDPGKLEKVVINILSNAFKFTPSEGSISIETNVNGKSSEKYPEGYLETIISDSGIGIKADNLEKIFDRFYQTEKSIGQHFEGTGIGLALSKEFVELHHGEIFAESNEGSDSKFIIKLPLGKNHFDKQVEIIDYTDYLKTSAYTAEINLMKKNIPKTEVSEKENINIDEKKMVILIVEDNEDVRSYVKEYLVPEYEVIEADNGSEGINIARERIPDLILSDIMMPGKDGFELCEILKNDIKTSHIPLILLTAKASEKNIIRGLKTKADDYITKPFSMNILLSRIKNLLELREQLHKKFRRETLLQPSDVHVSSIDEEFIKKLHELFEKNLTKPEWGIDELCESFNMSRAAFFRKVNAITGQPPMQYLQSYRLKRAAQLLKSKAGNITEIAFKVGFSNSAYFTKCFKKAFNQLPSDYHSIES